MKLKETIKPTVSRRIVDLIAEAGVDVTDWAESTKGNPASNPKYAYEWAFVDRDIVVLTLWYEDVTEIDGSLYYDLNLREWSEKVRNSNGRYPPRAKKLDAAISYAYEKSLPVRAIILDGQRRNPFDPNSLKASRVKLRRLDEESWAIQHYNPGTGEGRLTRGITPSFVDQFSAADDQQAKKLEVIATVWKRDPGVRMAVLNRASGVCELCGEPGFKTSSGEIYLETHHVMPLSEGGHDHERNVVAICPNDHKEAHYGNRRSEIRALLLAKLGTIK